jgi:trehalose 6-phosphate phosphatase
MTVLPLPLTPAIAERLTGRPFVALLDIDGTLAPIARSPDGAAVPDETRRIVAALAAQRDVIVVAVSGRAAEDAARILGVPGTWTIGNHGLETSAPNEPPCPRPELERFAGAMAAALEQCRAFASTHPGVIVEDKRWTLSIHYRLVDAPAVAAIVNGSRQIAERSGLRATSGRRVVEIRPPVDVDKGTASVDLLRRVGATSGDASVLCAGDDRTDEDMFRRVRAASPRAVTVRVLSDDDAPDTGASYESSAELTVPDPDAFRALLAAIVELRRA